MAADDRPDALVCMCAHAVVLSRERRQAAVEDLRAAGRRCFEVPDLCGLAARQEPMLRELADGPAPVVVACHPRAVRWLFHRAGAPLPGRAEIRDVREEGAGSESLESAADGAASANDWVPWYPVIDYDKCTGCRQCLDFCIFGVYTLTDDGRVEVARPENCKNNCPACARICPAVAIMFPKLNESPIDGSEVDDSTLSRARVRVNLDELLGDNARAVLLQRGRQNRGRLLKEEAVDKAEAERAACSCGCGCDAPSEGCDCEGLCGADVSAERAEDAGEGACGCGGSCCGAEDASTEAGPTCGGGCCEGSGKDRGDV